MTPEVYQAIRLKPEHIESDPLLLTHGDPVDKIDYLRFGNIKFNTSQLKLPSQLILETIYLLGIAFYDSS